MPFDSPIERPLSLLTAPEAAFPLSADAVEKALDERREH
jgi:hypothetical protein